MTPDVVTSMHGTRPLHVERGLHRQTDARAQVPTFSASIPRARRLTLLSEFARSLLTPYLQPLYNTQMNMIAGEKLRGHLEILALSVLEHGEAHGLEILHRLEAAGGGLLRLKAGSLYPALYRLEAVGAIKSVWESNTNGRAGGRRCIYRLTSKGRRKLKAARVDWQHFVRVLGGIMGPPTDAIPV